MLLFVFWLRNGHPLSRYDMEKLIVPGRSNLKAQYKDERDEKENLLYLPKEKLNPLKINGDRVTCLWRI